MSIALVGIGFAAMLALMFLGIPVAIAIVIVGAFGGYLMFGMPMVEIMGGVVWASLNSPSMLAIPLFMLLGELLLRSGIADKMFETLAVWFDRLPGGLLHTNIATCTLFSATSGSSVATAATVGSIALPALHERNYPVKPSLGTLAAGGTLGILIPPSVNLLVYGSLANTSVGQLFAAGVVPGLLLAALFSVYVIVFHRNANPVSPDERVPMREKIKLLVHLAPAVVIFVVVMGSIYGGLATPTESAALGVVIALGFVYSSGKLNWDLFVNCSLHAAKTTGMVVLVLACALLLNVTISMLGVTQTVTNWIVSFELERLTLLFILIGFYIVLGAFLDAMSMLVLTVPIALPMVAAVGVDPVWFGIFIVVMCEIALITPPVGMNLFVVEGVRADQGSFSDVISGTLPFVLIMIGAAILFVIFPEFVMWLPNMVAN